MPLQLSGQSIEKMSVVLNMIKDYGEDFSLNIPRLEILEKGIHVLWGPSGAGKSTIFRILLGLESCPNFSWIWNDLDLAKMPPPDRRIGIVFQSLDLFPHLSSKANIFFPAKARHIDMKKAEARYETLKSILKLNLFENRRVELLSGGERQRVALSRALMSFPRILFLDEPFSSLDEALKDEARSLLKSIIAETDTPALLITHDERDLKILADRVTKIEKGKLLA